MQTGSSGILIGWKSGKTLLSPSMGPNGGSVAMDSEVDSSVVSPGWSKKIAPSFLIELFVQHLWKILGDEAKQLRQCIESYPRRGIELVTFGSWVGGALTECLAIVLISTGFTTTQG
jgi:hypothetical protein